MHGPPVILMTQGRRPKSRHGFRFALLLIQSENQQQLLHNLSSPSRLIELINNYFSAGRRRVTDGRWLHIDLKFFVSESHWHNRIFLEFQCCQWRLNFICHCDSHYCKSYSNWVSHRVSLRQVNSQSPVLGHWHWRVHSAESDSVTVSVTFNLKNWKLIIMHGPRW